MRRRFLAMRLHPRNLRFEQSNPLSQFILRVGCQVFTSQPAGGITLEAGSVVFHLLQHRKANRLLSIRENGIRRFRDRGV